MKEAGQTKYGFEKLDATVEFEENEKGAKNGIKKSR